MPSIHTIDSRNHVMHEALRDHFAWNNERTFKEIQLLHKDLVTVLANKGIDYTELRSALTPQASKHETAFLLRYGQDWCTGSLMSGDFKRRVSADPVDRLAPVRRL